MKKLLLSTLLFLMLQPACAAPLPSGVNAPSTPEGMPRGVHALPRGTQVILVLGDSLSAAYGIDQKSGWVSLLQGRLDSEGLSYNVRNASISGDTSSGALARLGNELNVHQPDIVIIELGGNDGLRGLALNALEKNLAEMIEKILDTNARILLIGMRLPPNYGPSYTRQFSSVYQSLAARYKLALVPFLLDGMKNDSTFFQIDGIHPTNTAQPLILDNVWRYLQPLL